MIHYSFPFWSIQIEHLALYLDSFLVDGSSVSNPVDLCSSFNVDVEHKMTLLDLYSLRRSLIHSHGMSG